MNITLVVAASTNHVIGKNNQLLWHLPNDLKFFKNATWAMPIIMGRKTFESIGSKPLNGRLNIVITQQKNYDVNGAICANSMEAAIKIVTQNDYNEMMVVGGGDIYKQALPIAHKILLTRVHTHIHGDTFFPEIDTNIFQLIQQKDNTADDKHAFDYTFETWQRK